MCRLSDTFQIFATNGPMSGSANFSINESHCELLNWDRDRRDHCGLLCGGYDGLVMILGVKFCGNEPAKRKIDEIPDPIETEYKLGQDNVTPFGLDIHNLVFMISGISILIFVLIRLIFQEQAGGFFNWLRPLMNSNVAWFFLTAGTYWCRTYKDRLAGNKIK